MIIVESHQVREILTPEKCMQAMKEAFIALEKGECTMPLRSIHVLPNTAKFGFMPAYLGDYFGAKVISAYAPNMGTQYPSHIGYVMLFEGEHSTVAALVEAGSITEIRTGAASAVATEILARKDAHTLALIGAGAQARSHLAAIRLVRDIQQITVYDLNENASKKFAEEAQALYGIPVTIASGVAEAVKDADIICTLCPHPGYGEARRAHQRRGYLHPRYPRGCLRSGGGLPPVLRLHGIHPQGKRRVPGAPAGGPHRRGPHPGLGGRTAAGQGRGPCER